MQLPYLHRVLITYRYMRKILTTALLMFSVQAFAQDGLFNLEKPPTRHGLIFGANGGVDFPGGDMAERFGTSYRAGIQALYKTKSNWMFGPKFDYIFGTNLKEDSLMINIRDKYGSYINNIGQRIGVNVYQRGYIIGLQAGKIFNISKKNSDNGILAMTSVGFMEHKILIRDRESSIPSLAGDYVKGYDRLTNGIVLEQYIGYTYFSTNNLFHGHIGFNISAGFTKGRRDFLYDVMRTENAQRIDLLYGLRVGLYIPAFKRKSEDIFFE